MSNDAVTYGVMLFDVKTLKFTVLKHQLSEVAAQAERTILRSRGEAVYLFKNNPENYNGGHSGQQAGVCTACKSEADSVVYDMCGRVGNEDKRKKIRGY